MTEIGEKVNEILWEDFTVENSFPSVRPLLAHYTSIKTIESIIKNEELWLSHPLNMNDLEELQFGMVMGANTFRYGNILKNHLQSNVFAKLIEHFDKFYKEYETNHLFDTYVLCFAEHNQDDNDGVLSMWRAYGANGDGAAIVFDTSRINPSNDNPAFILGKVYYVNQNERVTWVYKKLQIIADFISDKTMDDEDLYEIAYYFFARLKSFSLFTKHTGFREENEWRMAYLKERDQNNIAETFLSYNHTSKGIEPILKYNLKKLNQIFRTNYVFEDLIDRIILGPTTSSPLAMYAVLRMLEQMGKTEIINKVIPSSIPYRNNR